MNWNSNDDEQIEETVRPTEQWWCCLALFMALVFGSSTVLIGYILFR